MELSDELKAAIKDAGPSEFADALQKEMQPYFQEVYDRGHSTATAQKSDTLQGKEQKISELEAQLQQKESELEQVREDKPDIEELRQQWEASELQPLQETKEQLESRLNTTRRQNELKSVEARIRDKVANEWVAERLVREAQDRIDVSGEDPTFYRPDGQTPYAAGDGQDARDLFAEDLLGSIPDDLRAPAKNQGSGYGGANGQASTKGLTKAQLNSDKAKKAEFMAEMRAQGKAPYEEYQQLPDE